MNYPDLGFALSLLVRGRFSGEATRLLSDLPHPLPLSLLHRLQIENGLLRELHSPDRESAAIARDAILLWRHYLLEQVFVIRSFEMEAAFSRAAAWNAGSKTKPLAWSLLLHPAIAAEEKAIFLSFNPEMRKLAKGAGLALLPKRLELPDD